MKLTIVQGDGWHGLYKDDKLMVEGHSISYEDLASVLGVTIKTVEPNQTWLEDRGNLPCDLAEVKVG